MFVVAFLIFQMFDLMWELGSVCSLSGSVPNRAVLSFTE